jgi:ribosome-interacting GTPase 1
MDYQKGKIYKIESHLGDKIYIGATTKEYLSQRMTAHRKNYKRWKNGNGGNVRSYELFEEYGIENCHIILLELCPCNSKDEMNAKEAHYIRTLTCVNKNIPGRTDKQYREDTKHIRVEYIKQYKEENKDKISKQRKQYKEDNKDSLKSKNAEYYQKIKEQRTEPILCECGCTIQSIGKRMHQRSKKHLNFEKNKTN